MERDKQQEKPQILIVDDAPVNIQLLEGILANENYDLHIAHHGFQAFRLLETLSPDVILLDIVMPGPDGFEVCEMLKARTETKDIPVVFLTGRTECRDIEKGFRAGAVDYVKKPFNEAELLARVRTHLELSRSREKLRRSEMRFRYLAAHDDLTDLYNTRHLYHDLPRLIRKSSARKRPFSLIFMDIDDFKHVVDTYGHLNGSRALAQVARTIRETLSEPAYGVAYGGDEFVIVLPDSDKSQALEKIEELRKRMARTAYLADTGHHVRIQASWGVATYPDDAENMDDLLALADQALFYAKARGKDAVGNLLDGHRECL